MESSWRRKVLSPSLSFSLSISISLSLSFFSEREPTPKFSRVVIRERALGKKTGRFIFTHGRPALRVIFSLSGKNATFARASAMTSRSLHPPWNWLQRVYERRGKSIIFHPSQKPGRQCVCIGCPKHCVRSTDSTDFLIKSVSQFLCEIKGNLFWDFSN